MSKEKDGKGKIRVFMFEVEGSNDTLLESVRGLTGAMNRAFGPTRVVVQQALPPASSGGTVDYEIADDLSDDNDDGDVASSSEETNSKPKKRSAPRTPKVLDDVDLKSGPVPLKEYMQHRNPANDYKRFLAIAAWFKEHGGVDAVSADHVYTAYRWMGWSPPKDLNQPFRDLKSKRGWLKSGSTRGTYEINHIGLDVAERMSGGVGDSES
jgi:hypothetical protein